MNTETKNGDEGYLQKDKQAILVSIQEDDGILAQLRDLIQRGLEEAILQPRPHIVKQPLHRIASHASKRRVIMGKKNRITGTRRHVHSQGHTDTQNTGAYRRTQTQAYRYRHRHRHRYRYTHTHTQSQRHRHRGTHRHTDRHIQACTQTQIDTMTHSHTDTQ